MPIPIVILAAGGSSRLGTPKQFIEFSGTTLIQHCVKAACQSACRPVLVVAGSESERISDLLKDLDTNVVENTRWQDGISTSIQIGISSALELEAHSKAIILSVCDQPFLTGKHLDALVKAYEQTGSRIVASSYAETQGVPALFDRTLFADLTALTGDAGAKRIIANRVNDTTSIPFPQGHFDIDTREDLEMLSGTAPTPR